MSSAVRSPMSRLNSRRAYETMSVSISSPPIRIDREITIPPSDVTATSVVPPPMSTIIDPEGSFTGRPAPIAAAIGSSTSRAHLADEVVEHLLGDVEVADDTVLERTDRDDARRRPPDHSLRLCADREDVTGTQILRDDRRLRDDDAASTHVDQRVRGPEIDADIAREQAEESVEQWESPSEGADRVDRKDNRAARIRARAGSAFASGPEARA